MQIDPERFHETGLVSIRPLEARGLLVTAGGQPRCGRIEGRSSGRTLTRRPAPEGLRAELADADSTAPAWRLLGWEQSGAASGNHSDHLRLPLDDGVHAVDATRDSEERSREESPG